MAEDVVIYTKPGCPFCKAAKEDFESKGIAFTERDITQDAEVKADAMRLAGVAAVPVIVRGDEIKVGFGGS